MIMERCNCGNFAELKNKINVTPMTSIAISELSNVMNRCRIICGYVKEECMEAAGLDKESVPSKER